MLSLVANAHKEVNNIIDCNPINHEKETLFIVAMKQVAMQNAQVGVSARRGAIKKQMEYRTEP